MMTALRSPRRLLRYAVIAVFGLLSITLLLLAGTVIYLRSSAGEAYLARTVVDILADAGIDAHIDTFHGPVPERLSLRGVRLADAQGVWLEAGEAEVSLDFSTLLHGTLEISLLKLKDADLLRFPVHPASTETRHEKSSPSNPADGVLPVLPLTIDLKRIDLQRVVIGKAIAGEAITLDLAGNMVLRDGHLAGVLDLQGRQEERGDLQLRLTLDTPVNGDRTAVTVHAEAKPGVAVVPEVSSLIGDGAHLEVTASVPAGFAPAGPFVISTLQIDAPAWAASLKEVRFSNDSVDDYAAEGSFQLSVTDGRSLEPVIGTPVQSGDLGGELLFSLKKTVVAFTANAQGAARVPDPVDARLALNGSFDWSSGKMPRVSSALKLTAQGNPWPSQELSALLGSEASVDLVVSGRGDGTYELALNALTAGHVTIKGNAGVAFAESDLETFIQDPEASFRQASLQTRFDVTLDDLSPITVAGDSSLKGGPVNATLRVEGTGETPHVMLIAAAPQVVTPSGTLSGLVLSLNASLSGMLSENSRDMRMTGVAGMHVGNVLGAPFAASFSWQVSPEQASVKSLKAHGAGVDLEGELAVRRPADTTLPPSVTGHLNGEVQSWDLLSHLSGIGLSGDGVTVAIKIAEENGQQNATARINAKRIAVRQQPGGPNDAVIEGLTVEADVGDVFGSPLGRLRMAGARGKAGTLALNRAEIAVDGGLDAGDFSLRLQKPVTSVIGNYRLDPAQTDELTQTHLITLNELRFSVPQKNIALRARSPVRIGLGEDLQLDGLDLDVGRGGSVKGNAFYGDGKLDVDLVVRKLSFSLLRLVSDADIPEGSVDIDARVQTENGNASGMLKISASGTVPEVSPPQNATVQLEARLSSSALKGQGQIGLARKGASRASINTAQLMFDVPLFIDAQGIPMPNQEGPLSGSFRWQGPIEQLWNLVPLSDRTLSGQSSIVLNASGTMQKPEAEVAVSLKRGRYDDKVYGLLLTEIDLNTRQDKNGKIEAILSFADGRGGSAQVHATVDNPLLMTLPGSEPLLSVNGSIRNLAPLHRDDLSITVSGPFTVEGPLSSPTVSSDIAIEKGELRLLSSLGAGVRTLDVVDSTQAKQPIAIQNAQDAELVVNVKIPRRFFIRGRGLDSEWQGQLAVTGGSGNPRLKGSLQPVRGQFELLSRPFAFSGGSITFLGSDPPDPALGLEMTYKGPSLTAIVRASGTASRPKLELDSNPPMPKDEIMAQVLFGKDASNLSHFEALQVANSLRTLAGAGDSGFDPMTAVRDTLGIDVLRFGGGGTASGSGRSRQGDTESDQNGDAMNAVGLEVGKYVLDNVYVGVEQGTTDGSTGVRVEIELLPNLRLDGRSDATSSEVGIGWKKDY